MEPYDLAIIGSGGGAFAAAIAAKRRELRVVMVERGEIGGTCVNVGCVPSKALLVAAESRHQALGQRFPGISTTAAPAAFPELIGGKSVLVEAMRAEKYVDLARDYGWEIVSGEARFTAGPTLEVAETTGGTRQISAKHYLVATGAAPWVPPIPGLEGVDYLTSTTAMELDALPESLLVIGGNAVGLEQAQLFAHLGARVTVVEALQRLAPAEEPQVDEVLRGVFAQEGIGVRTGVTLVQVCREGDMVVATLSDGHDKTQEISAAKLLVATGRRPVTAGLDLASVGVQTGARGEIIVDEHLATTNPRVWAAGDITGHPQFVYVAGAHGALVVDNAFGNAKRTLDYSSLPRITFTSPNIAAVGLTEEQAEKAGLVCTSKVLPLEYVPRAIVNRDTRGFAKIVAERATGRVVGATVVAQNAGDAILAAVYAMRAGMTVEDMAGAWAPYLTMAESLKLAAQTFDRDVSKLSCCAA